MRPNKYPERNAKILAERVAEFDAIEGPRVGDWLRLTDGSYARLANVEDSFFQCGVGSYYFYGFACDFSGSLSCQCPPTRALRQTGDIRPGKIWFFNGHEVGPNNGVDFEIEFRVFEIRDEYRDRPEFDKLNDWDWNKRLKT